MSNAVIYYGAPSSNRQIVSAEVRDRDLNLVRSSPTSAFPQVTRRLITSSYLHYVAQFGAAVKAAEKDQWITPGTSPYYYQSERTTTPVFMQNPSLVWNYSKTKTPDELSSVRDRFPCIEGTAKGRPAFIGSLSLDQVKALVADTDPEDRTPASTTTINLDAYRVYIKLYRLVDLVLRVHQYPLATWEEDTDNGDWEQTSFYESLLQIKVSDLGYQTVFKQGTPEEYKVFGRNTLDKYRFHTNLKQKDLAEVDYCISQASDLSADGIILFPFVQALARWDKEMVNYVVERYLRTLLGNDEGDAFETMNWIRSGMGVIGETVWGDELAHIFSGLRLMFETGARMQIIITPSNQYQGFLLVGGGYELDQFGQTYRPVKNTEFVRLFSRASPHQTNFEKILRLIQFPDDITRQGAIRDVQSIASLGQQIRQYGLNRNDEETVKNAAKYLCFPGDQFLPMTAVNVTRIFNAMYSSEPETAFPMHPNALMERDRKKRLLSAFGGFAPSFFIPGGRSVSLDTSFSYNVVSKGKKEAHTTTRMFVQSIPWEKACADLDRMVTERVVMTPIGTPIASRASSLSMIKEFAGNGGVGVLAAIRGLCGVTVSSSVTEENDKKRGRDADGDQGKKKRRIEF